MNDEAVVSEMLTVLADVAGGNLRRRVSPPGDSHDLDPLARAINALIEAWRTSEVDARRLKKTLEAKVALIETQNLALRELSTPLMEVWDDVLLLPIIGVLHEKRSAEVMNDLLDRIVQSQTSQVILDITGLDIVDTSTADQLLRIVAAAQLLGARCVLTGVSVRVAQTLAGLDVDLGELRTLRTLADGLLDCVDHARRRNARAARPERSV
jgi:rsbT co-antagonist protein RsbR